MKFVIFADKAHNYIKPMAYGLSQILKNEGHEYIIYENGVNWLDKPSILKTFVLDIYRLYKNIIAKNNRLYIYRSIGLINFLNKKRTRELDKCDCIIIIQNCPRVFYKESLKRIDYLRERFNKPIVNYDLHYLPNQGWYGMIKKRNSDNYGLERFDWYLIASIVTEYALPIEIPKIYSNIGFNIKDNTLYPEQKEFIALLDFERPGYEIERSIQVTALKNTKTKYIELNGRYTTEEIRSIYRKSSIYFLAFRESFGLPILELQHCGSYIFTPYKEWAPAHFLNKNIYLSGYGDLGENFFVYENDLSKLEKLIVKIKKEYNAQKVIDNFKRDYPFYYQYNKQEFQDFTNKLSNKIINEKSHYQYQVYNDKINKEDEVSLFNK